MSDDQRDDVGIQDVLSATSNRREFIRSGATVTSALFLGGSYIKPMVQSVPLGFVTNPSAGQKVTDKKKKKKGKHQKEK